MLFITFLVAVLLSYCFIILPNKQTTDSFDPDELTKELDEISIMQRDREERGATGVTLMTGRALYSVYANYYKLHMKMITAFEDEDFTRFIHLKTHYLSVDGSGIMSDPELFTQSPFPGKDRKHLYHQTLLSYQGYLDENIPISYAMIEQKTALQTLQNVLLSFAGYLIIFCAIYFSSDVLLRDRQNQSMLQGLPLSWYRVLNIKTLVAFLYTLIVLTLLFIVGMIIISFQNGFGFFNIQVPIMTFAEWNFSLNDYDVMSIGKFIVMTLSFIPILVYLFIRLNIVFSLLFKNEWLVLLISTLVLFSERLYFTRRLRELFGIEISYFPQTYFDFGKVVSGEKNFLVNLDTITYVKGITLLVSTIFIIECILFIVSRIVGKRRFYQKIRSH